MMVFSSRAQMRIKDPTFPIKREREREREVGREGERERGGEKGVFERFMLLQILFLKFIIKRN